MDLLDKHLTGELIAIEVLYCLSGVGEDLDIASVDIQCLNVISAMNEKLEC